MTIRSSASMISSWILSHSRNSSVHQDPVAAAVAVDCDLDVGLEFGLFLLDLDLGCDLDCAFGLAKQSKYSTKSHEHDG